MTVKLERSAETLRKRFGLWLKAKREEHGLTQLDIAAHVPYSYPVFVSQIERGVSALPSHDMLQWAEILRVSPKDFAKEYLYFYEPFIYECMFGIDPYAREKLPRGGKTTRSAPVPRTARRPSKS